MRDFVPLEYGQYYHIYNRGNNGENIFSEERNYPYFLGLYVKHIEPVSAARRCRSSPDPAKAPSS